jgi:hypothetical protein
VVWAASAATERLVAPEAFLQQTIGVVIPVVLGVIAYFLLARALDVEELDLARGLLRRRLSKKG